VEINKACKDKHKNFSVQHTTMKEIPEWLSSKDVKEIMKKLSKFEAVKAYELAEFYCDNVCKKRPLSPMISCAYNCEIWKFKNKFLSQQPYDK
jgi:hypothetical protein